MRKAAPALAVLLLIAACSSGAGPSTGTGSPAPAVSSPSPSPSAVVGPGLTQDACRALTATDVQAALGIPVSQLPLTSPPPGAEPGAALVSGCTYASAASTPGGASLYLYRDVPIDSLASAPGFQRVPGVGDAAYANGPMLFGRKGHVTFQLSVEPGADPAKAGSQVIALARAVANRL